MSVQSSRSICASVAGLILAFTAFLGSLTPNAAAQSPAATNPVPPLAQQFFAALRKNFNAWDINRDGRLTREEIEIDMQKPRITGDAAAALAALKLSATKVNQLPATRTYTLADIDELEMRFVQGVADKADKRFIRDFNRGLLKLQEMPRDVFADRLPHLTSIHQDSTTDCYFLSAVGALVQARPQAIRNLIAANPDGSYTVFYPGKPAVRVPAPTDAEIAAYSQAKDGIWLNLLERAYAILRIKAEPLIPFTREPMDSIGFRTGSSGVMELVTGHHSKVVTLTADNHRPVDATLLQQLRSVMMMALRERRIMETQKASHDFAVTGFDPASDLVTLHNPYDSGGFEGLPDGTKIERNPHGFFQISTAQFAEYFKYLRVEATTRG
jgi:hypothetical protein